MDEGTNEEQDDLDRKSLYPASRHLSRTASYKTITLNRTPIGPLRSHGFSSNLQPSQAYSIIASVPIMLNHRLSQHGGGMEVLTSA